MKVGVVGVGNMGRHYVNKLVLLGMKPVLIDKSTQALNKFDKNLPKYTDLDQALKENEFDYLFVATAPTSHLPIAKKAIEKNINVMVEKPPALSSKELEETINLAISKDVVLGVSEIELRSSCIRNFKKEGSYKSIEAYRLNLGQGYINPFFDLAWHDLYILQYLFESINIKKAIDLGDIYEVYGETDEGEFFIKVGWNQANLRREWILTKDEEKTILDFTTDTIYYPKGKAIEGDKKDKLETMIGEFLDKPSFDSSFRALKVLKQIEKIT